MIMIEGHAKVFKQIVLGQFPQQFVNRVYSRESKSNRIYLEAMDQVREYVIPTKSNPRACFWHDGILMFFPDQKREDYRIITVSIEIKTNLENLKSDEKIDQYLGATNYFFLAVPHHLVEAAQKKILSPFEKRPYKGVIDATSGKIIVMPKCQELDRERHIRLSSSMFLTKRRIDEPRPEYQIHQLTVSSQTLKP
ncbi:MAG: hypothetical protein II841_02110 [Bacteroidales bacterium]|nr:hypothetical protein [Bacteroidales bacterium]